MLIFLRVKKAEECFKQAREKASYSVKPKHATGIVRRRLSSLTLSGSDFDSSSHTWQDVRTPPLALFADFQTVAPPAVNFFFSCLQKAKLGQKIWSRRWKVGISQSVSRLVWTIRRQFIRNSDRSCLLPVGFACLCCLSKWMSCGMIKWHFHTIFRFHGNDETKGLGKLWWWDVAQFWPDHRCTLKSVALGRSLSTLLEAICSSN